MPIDQDERTTAGALERARVMSQALADAARRARFSTRSRRALASGGFQARRGARAMRMFRIATFALVVLVPSIGAAAYYAFIASNQYVAEAQFTVMGGEVPAPDAIASMTGIPAAAIIQDTQIVTNFIESRAAVEKLEASVGLRQLYSGGDIDYLARFDPSKPVEKLVSYWRRMADASIIMPAGIVDLKVRAFTPEDARAIADSVLDLSEQLINDLNARMNADAVRDAEQELQRTAERLAAARAALEKARNDQGVIDAVKQADAINKLATDLRGQLARMQQEYDAQLHAVLSTAPQMRTLKARIEAGQAQIAELEARLTAADPAESSQTLSNSMTRFAQLDLEHQIAERLYSGAAASLELARLTGEHKLMYLNTFVRPVAPQEPRYPKRILYTAAVVVGSLAAWGALVGGVAVARNHMA
ncbi:capsular polysaccharide transport system permease protein [Roseiarcus fermentans]|uniref:Capsular polysaccharide transport system permease protein n=1 Tax=Roseiarcus fermentans TaxID=1473586 RepID=A0A366ESG6_9HYPH|nr:lipopolysaccharide biosynthesis protein [Roseiarcus fermentans]RBP04630.1 capsular polysaccharide transport system permease protein [Roseiarcus fermentans]